MGMPEDRTHSSNSMEFPDFRIWRFQSEQDTMKKEVEVKLKIANHKVSQLSTSLIAKDAQIKQMTASLDKLKLEVSKRN